MKVDITRAHSKYAEKNSVIEQYRHAIVKYQEEYKMLGDLKRYKERRTTNRTTKRTTTRTTKSKCY